MDSAPAKEYDRGKAARACTMAALGKESEPCDFLGPRFEPERDRAAILDGTAQIVGVPTVEQAARQAERLYREGVDCIELCGAFGEAGARAVIAATHNQVPVGFVTHLPEQEELFRTTFGG